MPLSKSRLLKKAMSNVLCYLMDYKAKGVNEYGKEENL